MLVLMQCVAEAVAARGIRGLAEFVPGVGPFLYEVANDAHRRLREHRLRDKLGEEVRLAAAASFDEAKAAAERVAREVAAAGPVEDRLALELYLSQIPGAVRRSLRRVDDPVGKTVPAGLVLDSPTKLFGLLPPQMPRFRPGCELPGKPGWTLVEPLGAGGFGEVWRCEHPLVQDSWAVKFCTDPAAQRLLRHEGELIARVRRQVRHRHVVGLIDADLTGPVPWLAYEYVAGGDLTERILAWQRLPIEARVARALETLKVLAAAAGKFHRLDPPVVHRDLKPANILVHRPTPRQVVFKITDFGIGGVAAAREQTGSRGGASVYSGARSLLAGAHTPLYASPQQIQGKPADPRDDVYALGVIAYQMLTGLLDVGPGPRYDRDLEQLGVVAEVVELIGDCVDRKVDGRPPDGQALFERLTAVTTAAPPEPAPPAPEPTVVDLAAVDPVAEQEARERLLAENFDSWMETGDARRWVKGNGGVWDRRRWATYTEQLRRSNFWPLPLELVRLEVERQRQALADRQDRRPSAEKKGLTLGDVVRDILLVLRNVNMGVYVLLMVTMLFTSLMVFDSRQRPGNASESTAPSTRTTEGGKASPAQSGPAALPTGRR